MYVEGSASNMNKKATLYSQVHDLLGVDHCLTADLVLTDDSGQQIQIEALEKDSTRRHAVGTLSGDLGSSWFRGNWSLPVTLTTKPFQVSLPSGGFRGHNESVPPPPLPTS